MRNLCCFLAFLGWVVLSGDPAKAYPDGILELCDLCEGADCQVPYLITDPCVPMAFPDPDINSSFVVLDPFLCRHVDMVGFYDGLGCFHTQTVVETAPVCANVIRELAITGGANAVLHWERRPCAASYDVVRGEITPESAGISVGIVTCIADTLPQQHPLDPVMFGLPDTEIPAVGRAFSYLVRANGAPYGGNGYGRGSDGTERVPLSGDCPP